MASYSGIGARLTPPEILALMREVAGALASRGYCLRTGGARGADQAFFDGADTACGRIDLFLPWPGFWAPSRAPWPNVSVFERPTPEAYRLAEQYHPNWRNLRRGPKSLHARNVHIVLGPNLDDPVRLICCWTPAGQLVGGTAQALRIAAHHNIPVFNLADPMTRQRVLSSIRGPHAQNAHTAGAGVASEFSDAHGEPQHGRARWRGCLSVGRRGPLAPTDVTRTWEVAAELERILAPGFDLVHSRRGDWHLRQFDTWLDHEQEPRETWRTIDSAPRGQLGALLIRHQEQRRGVIVAADSRR